MGKEGEEPTRARSLPRAARLTGLSVSVVGEERIRVHLSFTHSCTNSRVSLLFLDRHPCSRPLLLLASPSLPGFTIESGLTGRRANRRGPSRGAQRWERRRGEGEADSVFDLSLRGVGEQKPWTKGAGSKSFFPIAPRTSSPASSLLLARVQSLRREWDRGKAALCCSSQGGRAKRRSGVRTRVGGQINSELAT